MMEILQCCAHCKFYHADNILDRKISGFCEANRYFVKGRWFGCGRYEQAQLTKPYYINVDIVKENR